MAQFALIRAHLGIVRQGKRSGMKAWETKPTFIAGKPTWSHSAIWYAGAIAHDAFHAALYAKAKKQRPDRVPEADRWTGAAAEKQCLAFQRQVLLALQADAGMIGYLDGHAQNPKYQGRHNGWRSWLDYLKRRW